MTRWIAAWSRRSARWAGRWASRRWPSVSSRRPCSMSSAASASTMRRATTWQDPSRSRGSCSNAVHYELRDPGGGTERRAMSSTEPPFSVGIQEEYLLVKLDSRDVDEKPPQALLEE